MINRSIKGSIEADYRRKKVIVLLGARQVGKTTLLTELRNDVGALWENLMVSERVKRNRHSLNHLPIPIPTQHTKSLPRPIIGSL